MTRQINLKARGEDARLLKSPRDRHPENDRSQKQSFARSISTPVIVAIEEQESIEEMEHKVS